MRVVSLFSGAGGLDLGFVQAGHKIIWANDNDPDSVETYRKNIGNHIVLGDIQEISDKDIPECDIVVGGFPCQGFSVANPNRHVKDVRNSLYLELLRVIKIKKPKYFVAENVKGLLTMDGGKILALIIDDFKRAGYNVSYRLLNAADYGVPQKRQRVIIIGVRSDIKKTIEFPKPTHTNMVNVNNIQLNSSTRMKPWVSIGSALKGIPEPYDAPHIPNHTHSQYKLTFNGYLGHRRINPDEPAPTVTARGDLKGGVVVLHHPNNHRRMSARELASAQSFPMDYEFQGARSSVYRQIGNAVPVLLGKAIGSCFPLK